MLTWYVESPHWAAGSAIYIIVLGRPVAILERDFDTDLPLVRDPTDPSNILVSPVPLRQRPMSNPPQDDEKGQWTLHPNVLHAGEYPPAPSHTLSFLQKAALLCKSTLS